MITISISNLLYEFVILDELPIIWSTEFIEIGAYFILEFDRNLSSDKIRIKSRRIEAKNGENRSETGEKQKIENFT